MENDSSLNSPRVSVRRWLLPIAGALVLGGIVVMLVRIWPANNEESQAPPEKRGEPPVDPRFTDETRYRNVRPDVKYVGDAKCAECHGDIAETYRQHPMGRSLVPIAVASPLEQFGTAARNPFDAGGFRYRVEHQENRVIHKEFTIDSRGGVVAETTAEVQFAVGSGRSGRAYLIERDGFLFTSPITWYPQKGIWDLSPGYENHNPHFDRPIRSSCLFCHANSVECVPQSLNHYRQPIFRGGHAIGCERCHGPGELHVQRWEHDGIGAKPDDTIVNPVRLEPALREAVCQQCHLQGQARVWRRGRDTFDFRPGLPFHAFMSEFVKPPEQSSGNTFVGSVEQMYASRCFQKSRGSESMGCISCHDPHVLPSPEKKTAWFRGRCLSCHQDKGCSAPAAERVKQVPDDSCIACHMPKTGSNINHTAITDHRIPRRPAASEKPVADWPRIGTMPLVHFHHDLLPANDDESDRDLGIALIGLADSQASDAVVRWLAGLALPKLEAAVRRDPEDTPALAAKGNALWFLGRLEEAWEVYQGVLERAPERETTLFSAANLALRLQRWDAARQYAERLVKGSPWRWQHQELLATMCAHSNDWAGAAAACRKALALNAADFGSRRLLVLCHLRLNERAEAQKQFDTLMGLNPPQPDALRRWFAGQTR